jgi:Ca2+-dependent lipid-binding protein
MSAQQHHLHEPYSSRNPVPNVPKFLAEQAKKVNPVKEDASKKEKETTREVVDPTTKNNVIIQDVDADYAKAVSDPHVIPFNCCDNNQVTVPRANLPGQNAAVVPSTQAAGVQPIRM